MLQWIWPVPLLLVGFFAPESERIPTFRYTTIGTNLQVHGIWFDEADSEMLESP